MTTPPGPPPEQYPYPSDPYGQQPGQYGQSPSYGQNPSYGPPPGQYGQQPNPYGQPQPYPGGPAPAPSTNGMAIAALITGIIGAILLSVPFGIVALNQTKGGRQSGRGMAIAALVISGVWLIIFAIIIAAIAFSGPSVRAVDITTGDCISEVPADMARVVQLPKVSCDEPHKGEVYATIPVSGETFPGQQALVEQYESQCQSALAGYSSTAAGDDQFSIYVLYPSQETWDRNDRRVACLVTTEESRTGSVKN